MRDSLAISIMHLELKRGSKEDYMEVGESENCITGELIRLSGGHTYFKDMLT